VQRGIHISINGLAAGLRNTGWAFLARRRRSPLHPHARRSASCNEVREQGSGCTSSATTATSSPSTRS